MEFHAAVGDGSLIDLLEERVTLEAFLERMRGYWWSRTASWDESITRGLFKTLRADRFESSLDVFASRYDSDPWGAAGWLVRALFDPLAADQGRASWVAQDPENVLVAPFLFRLIPDMKLIHVVRDGRDVAVSQTHLPWGSTSLPRGLWDWLHLMLKADRATRDLPADRVLVVGLEALVSSRRDESYQRILDFLALDDEEGMRSFFDTRITGAEAHIGRWKEEMTRSRQLAITVPYSFALTRLSRTAARPYLRLKGFNPSHATPPDPAREIIDPWSDGQARNA
jgi:hypothetical protein